MLGGMYQAARAAYAATGRLFEAHLDVLYQCDLDCTHCYLDDKSKRVLPTEFWLDVIAQLAELGCFSVTLSGGEVFLRKDALELIAAARRAGIFVHVKTHGGLVDEAVAARLAELRVSSVQVSYYATDPAIHDAITRRPGSHAATLAGIRALRRHDLLVLAACSVLEANRAEAAAVEEQLTAMGVGVKLDAHVRVANSGADFPLDVGLGAVGLQALYRATGSGADICAVEEAGPSDGWGSEKLCVAGHLSLYIGPEGVVTPCVTWPEPLADLRAGARLADVWASSPRLAQIRSWRKADRTPCGGCQQRAACDYCPGQAYLDSREPLRAAETLCRTTYARAAARDPGVALPAPLSSRPFQILRGSR